MKRLNVGNATHVECAVLELHFDDKVWAKADVVEALKACDELSSYMRRSSARAGVGEGAALAGAWGCGPDTVGMSGVIWWNASKGGELAAGPTRGR